jgi:hypothetical protein
MVRAQSAASTTTKGRSAPVQLEAIWGRRASLWEHRHHASVEDEHVEWPPGAHVALGKGSYRLEAGEVHHAQFDLVAARLLLDARHRLLASGL